MRGVEKKLEMDVTCCFIGAIQQKMATRSFELVVFVIANWWAKRSGLLPVVSVLALPMGADWRVKDWLNITSPCSWTDIRRRVPTRSVPPARGFPMPVVWESKSDIGNRITKEDCIYKRHNSKQPSTIFHRFLLPPLDSLCPEAGITRSWWTRCGQSGNDAWLARTGNHHCSANIADTGATTTTTYGEQKQSFLVVVAHREKKVGECN